MCRFRYYNPRVSWVLKHSIYQYEIPESPLQPTCIVGTKTMINFLQYFFVRYYNPRASWVLKFVSHNSLHKYYLHYSLRTSWMFRIKIAIKKRHFISDAFFKMTHKKNVLANLLWWNNSGHRRGCKSTK